jgi:nitroreductase
MDDGRIRKDGDGSNVLNGTTLSPTADVATTSTPTAGPSDPAVIQAAFECLDAARRAPSGFNVQPYRMLLVHSPRQREALARYCIGRNADRVRDSDCTAVFLADRQCLRTLPTYRAMLRQNNPERWYHTNRDNNDDDDNNNAIILPDGGSKADQPRREGRRPRWRLVKLQLLVALFSSGWPFPAVVSGPVSAVVGLAVRVVSWICRDRFLVPTLSGPETWSQKNTMMAAMSYLLACTSRGLATTPMEGYLSWGVRRALRIPRRYTIPLIVATGRPYRYPPPSPQRGEGGDGIGVGTTSSGEDASSDALTGAAAAAASSEGTVTKDDAGMAHGNTRETATPRFPTDSVIYGDEFGARMHVDMS